MINTTILKGIARAEKIPLNVLIDTMGELLHVAANDADGFSDSVTFDFGALRKAKGSDES